MLYPCNKKVSKLQKKLEEAGFKVVRVRKNEVLLQRYFRDSDSGRLLSVILYSDDGDVTYKALSHYDNDSLKSTFNQGRAYYQFHLVLDGNIVNPEKSLAISLPGHSSYKNTVQPGPIIYSKYYELIHDMQVLICILGAVKCKNGHDVDTLSALEEEY